MNLSKHIYKAFILLTFTLFTYTNVSAQFQNDQFGKNRVQYKNFDWKFISTSNFDIYYYQDGYESAKIAAEFAEADFNRITDLVSFSPYNKIKLFIYNSIVDLQQSNIGVNHQGFAVGGQTNFVRSEVELAFTGTKQGFKQELSHGIADILIFEMMYGGNLKEILQSNYLLNLPEWFMAGAANYIAYGWDVSMDDYMRDMINSKKLKKPSNLEGDEAKMIGQGIWNYIAEKYGKANVGHILNYTRIVRNEKTSIQNTLGVSYNQFIASWREFYTTQATKLKADHSQPKEQEISIDNQKGYTFNKVKISPDEKYIAYTENLRGRFKVKVVNTRKDNEESTLFVGGYKVLSQRVDHEIPVISWFDDHTLGIFAPKNGSYSLWTYDLEAKKGKKFKKLDFANFDQVKDFNISSDGRQLVMSVERKGQSDVFIYNLFNKRLTQITDDIFDEANPHFFANSNKIVFSSNRTKDTPKISSENIKEISNNFNIFLYDPAKPNELDRLTNTISKDINPHPINNHEILFLSDQRGIFHLYKYNLNDSITTQLTNYTPSIEEFDYSPSFMTFIMHNDGIDHIYEAKRFDTNQSTFTSKTYRQQILDLRNLQALKKKRELEAEKEKLKEEQKAAAEKEKIEESQPKEDGLPNDEVDTDNYQFNTFSKDRRQSFLDRFKSKVNTTASDQPKELRISKPIPYENRFTADNFVTNLLIDPLRGWGLLFEVEMTDLLENHKIDAGLFFLTNLQNSNFFAEYKFLKHRLDFNAKYERHNLQLTDEIINHAYSMNLLKAGVSYPFNITSRITFEPLYATTRFTNTTLSSLTSNDVVVNYGGFNAEFVFDNSIVTGVNMLEGTRAKVRLEQYYGLSDSNRSFGNFTVDVRHYQKLHRSLIFATRFSYGQFIGAAKKNYLLGGMDNWIFNNRNLEEENNKPNPLIIGSSGSQDMSDLLFARFITPLRGFRLNELYGENFMLFNAELRFPVFKYFYKRTITSNFFRNLQLTAFTDVGSSWTGLSPFNRENALNTSIVESGAFRAEVSNFTNPFLIGYGVGARSMLLGYYTKFDVGWGLEDGVVGDPRFYLTLGYDF